MRCTRRAMLAGGVAFASRAWAFGDTTRVDLAELDLGPGTLSRPNAWKRLLYELMQTTSVECLPRAVPLGPSDAELFEHPMAVIVADGEFADPGVGGRCESNIALAAQGPHLRIARPDGFEHPIAGGVVDNNGARKRSRELFRERSEAVQREFTAAKRDDDDTGRRVQSANSR